MVYSKWYRKMGQKNKYEYHLNFKHKGKQKKIYETKQRRMYETRKIHESKYKSKQFMDHVMIGVD